MTSQTNATITCEIQTTGVVTNGNKVLHNTCNMCIRDLPDMNALIPWACEPQALGIHIRQILHVYITTITCALFSSLSCQSCTPN